MPRYLEELYSVSAIWKVKLYIYSAIVLAVPFEHILSTPWVFIETVLQGRTHAKCLVSKSQHNPCMHLVRFRESSVAERGSRENPRDCNPQKQLSRDALCTSLFIAIAVYFVAESSVGIL